MSTTGSVLEKWGCVELTRGERVYGMMSEGKALGSTLLRVALIQGGTQFYPDSSIYCVTPLDSEATTRKAFAEAWDPRTLSIGPSVEFEGQLDPEDLL